VCGGLYIFEQSISYTLLCHKFTFLGYDFVNLPKLRTNIPTLMLKGQIEMVSDTSLEFRMYTTVLIDLVRPDKGSGGDLCSLAISLRTRSPSPVAAGYGQGSDIQGECKVFACFFFLDISQVSGTRKFLLVAKDRGRMGDFCKIFFLGG
jgi:hypothetical protein